MDEYTQIISDLDALGIQCYGVINGNLMLESEEDRSIADAVCVAYNQLLDSDECLALQLLLTSEQWLAYLVARKTPIRLQREQRYRTETDPLRMKLDEDFTLGSSEWLARLEEWKSAKAKIREELPYPE
jgi:hypothetical protein